MLATDDRRGIGASWASIRPGLPRWLEAGVAVLAIAVLSPLYLVIAAVLKGSSPGSVLFRQRRVGRNGREFVLLKFRSMRQDLSGPPVTTADDSRITPVGRFLRRSKLDELPSLWNILTGDMSFVGPRPEVPELVDTANERWRFILLFRPGLTDPVSVALRNEEMLLAQVAALGEDPGSFYRNSLLPWKLEGSAQYLMTRTARTDVGILVSTLSAVFRASRSQAPSPAEIRSLRTDQSPQVSRYS
jgi:lipopolysaccharide/colanic/teichoic acid biosynthesis glycosyltransferase